MEVDGMAPEKQYKHNIFVYKQGILHFRHSEFNSDFGLGFSGCSVSDFIHLDDTGHPSSTIG